MNSEQKFSFLWKLSRCEETPVIGTHTCSLCGVTEPLKHYRCIEMYFPSSVLHFVEYHGYKPTQIELNLVDNAYVDRMKNHKYNEKKYMQMKFSSKL